MWDDKRIAALAAILEEEGLGAILIEEPLDIYYLTGIELSAGKLLVHKGGAILVVDGRYFEACRGHLLVDVRLFEPEVLRDLFDTSLKSAKTLAFVGSKTTCKRYHELEALKELIRGDRGDNSFELLEVEDFVLELRSIKGEEEIRLLREAAHLGSKGYDYVLSLLREGITEIEVAKELEIFWLKQGADGLGFDPIIAFAENTAKPHYRAGEKKLKADDIVLIDIGVKNRRYFSDMTRVHFFGKVDPRLQEIYEIVKEAQLLALKLCKPGTRVGDLDLEARTFITDRGFGPEFSHSLGHGVGLEIHELPVIKSGGKSDAALLQPGMVITIEPGIYLTGIGGIRIEDTVLITEEGHENLTERPK